MHSLPNIFSFPPLFLLPPSSLPPYYYFPPTPLAPFPPPSSSTSYLLFLPFPLPPSSFGHTFLGADRLMLLTASYKHELRGSLGGLAVWCLPSAQGVILEFPDQVPCWAPCMESASVSACVSASLSICVSHE